MQSPIASIRFNLSPDHPELFWANLLSFFQLLRSKLGQNAILSAAVTDQPFTGPDGQPLKDVSAYAQVMTYVNLM